MFQDHDILVYLIKYYSVAQLLTHTGAHRDFQIQALYQNE